MHLSAPEMGENRIESGVPGREGHSLPGRKRKEIMGNLQDGFSHIQQSAVFLSGELAHEFVIHNRAFSGINGVRHIFTFPSGIVISGQLLLSIFT